MNKIEIEIIKEHENEYLVSRIQDILYEVETLRAVKDDLNHNKKLDKFGRDALELNLETLKRYIEATKDVIKVLGWSN